MSTAPAPFDPDAHRRFATGVLAIFLVVFVALAWAPVYREDWLLENVLVFVLVPFFIISFRRLPLSRISYVSLLLFLVLHEIGAHYTYAEVPYDAAFEAVFGRGLNGMIGWERNHYDRLVHFLYGALITYPTREIFLRVANARGFWAYLFPLLVVMSSSLLFELIEWGAALVFGGDLGMAYLGTQGDVWDSHKDSALATLGSLIASVAIAGIHAGLDRDFTREWVESLRVKDPMPLGEVAVERMRHEGDAPEEEEAP